ncbi:helix-turn-helix domain-containing protein [Sediminispirochaeta smaragdinae]|uniref:DNA binding domain protein, excisionase family n=1 Tax=Sediminispirochaeta smaragdinae (strain DSM 11293 / JCM 15392 / SEBR 4228) TaxID=573413 RepID=E1R1F0_SEDSS|nr:helix-turn-helix domain-containing protein [Sediminispirochaeta smaragdinae]ADK81091.1 DNA binding domain protein, excisionase family [Sediminispirochaeta smaragdinae DSM 11293]
MNIDGRLEAMLEIIEQTLSEIKEREEHLAGVSHEIELATRDIEELRGITGSLAEIVESGKRIEWMTTTEVADELHVNKQTVRRWADTGLLRCYRIVKEGHRRFDRREIYEDVKRMGDEGNKQ